MPRKQNAPDSHRVRGVVRCVVTLLTVDEDAFFDRETAEGGGEGG